MSNLFLYFLIYLSVILLSSSKLLIYGILIFSFCLFVFIKRVKKDKKVLIIGIIILFVSLAKVLLSKIEFPVGNELIGIVLRRRENYFIVFNGLNKFYVPIKESAVDELDIVRIKGSAESFYFSTLENGFNFNEYLLEQGIKKQLSTKSLDTIIDFPINFYAYKSFILNKFSSENSRLFVSGILFSSFNGSNEFSKQIKMLNLTILFSTTGVYLNFFLYSVSKLLSLKLSDKKADIISFLLFSPYLFFNITRFTTIKVTNAYIFRMINKYGLNNYYSKIERLSILGIVYLFINPFLVFNMSFYLSYLISIVLNYSYLFLMRYKRMKKYLMTHLLLFLITLPFCIKNVHTINIFNSATSYLLMIVFKPLFVLLLPLFYGLYIPLYNSLIEFIINFILKINFRIFDVNVPEFGQIVLIIYYLLLVFIIYFLEVNNKKIANKCLLIVSILFSFYVFPINNLLTFEVDFINVGQGDSTLIRYQNTTILIDTGGLTYQDIAVNNLIPFLKENRIYKIDALFITHKDYDHYGALDSLNNYFKISNLFDYNDVFPVNINNILFKNLNTYASNSDEENYRSLVLNFKIKNVKFLLMGDAPKEIESKIIESNEDLSCDYLKVGHHGSNTSTSEAFIKKVRPKEAIISCGYNNRYKHPHSETIKILKKYKVTIRRTDLEGTIKYKFFI